MLEILQSSKVESTAWVCAKPLVKILTFGIFSLPVSTVVSSKVIPIKQIVGSYISPTAELNGRISLTSDRPKK